MKFDEAFKLMKQGKGIRRAEWGKGYVLAYECALMHKKENIYEYTAFLINVNTMPYEVVLKRWVPSDEDLFADDWEVSDVELY